MKTALKSIGAFVAAVAVVFVLSYGTDAILIAAHAMPANGLPDSAALTAFIVAYRSIYGVIGAFILAKLAPNHPARHAIVLAAFSILGSLGAMTTISNTKHGWYAWVLMVLVIPSIWLGTKLALRKKD